MLAVWINAVLIVAGGVIGSFTRKLFGEKLQEAILQGMGLCVLVIGFDGALKTSNILITILSIGIGGVIGTLIDIDEKTNRLGLWLEKKVSKGRDIPIAKGFVSGTLLFCVGAMAVVGSFNAGINKDYSVLLSKSVIDFCSAVAMSAAMGIGVALSAVPIVLYQGSLCLLAGVLAPLLTEGPRTELIAAGSVMIIGIGLKMLGLSKVKVANYLPAMILAPILYAIF